VTGKLDLGVAGELLAQLQEQLANRTAA
jgi:hypothetical protein